MRTANNIYVGASDPYKRFVKTVIHPITGWRIDPENNRQVEFILVSMHTEFDYDSEVLEIYTEKEYKFLQQKNRYLFESGLLKEFTGEADDVDMTNVLTDDEIFTLAGVRLPNDLKGRLRAITSVVTIKRVLSSAKEIGRPAKVIGIIEERLQQLAA